MRTAFLAAAHSGESPSRTERLSALPDTFGPNMSLGACNRGGPTMISMTSEAQCAELDCAKLSVAYTPTTERSSSK